MKREKAVRLIGREAGYEMAFAIAEMAVSGTVLGNRISDETERVVMGIVDQRTREYQEHLSTRSMYDQFIDAMMETYNAAYPRISKPDSTPVLGNRGR